MSRTKVKYKTYAAIFMLDQIIRKDGYKSKSKFGGECTSFVCEQEMINLDESPTVGPNIFPNMVAHINQLLNDGSSSFYTSCRDAIAKYDSNNTKWELNETIWNYQIGFLAPLVNTIIKKENEPEKPDLSHLGYIGTEGKRGKFFVKLTEMFSKDDYTIHKVVDKKGNRGMFYHYKFRNHKGGEHADDDTVNYTDAITNDDCFMMTATPARHQINRYDGGKETYFNRITIEENKGSLSR